MRIIFIFLLILFLSDQSGAQTLRTDVGQKSDRIDKLIARTVDTVIRIRIKTNTDTAMAFQNAKIHYNKHNEVVKVEKVTHQSSKTVTYYFQNRRCLFAFITDGDDLHVSEGDYPSAFAFKEHYTFFLAILETFKLNQLAKHERISG